MNTLLRIAPRIILATLLLGVGAPALAGDISALDAAVKAWSKDADVPSYSFALADLNGDGIDDAIALITAQEYCGSGGCSLVIFRGEPKGFKLVSSSSITRPPILLLPEKRYGWHTLSVMVAGGGAEPGQVLMRFNGHKYPYNPSMQPKAKESALKDATTLKLQEVAFNSSQERTE